MSMNQKPTAGAMKGSRHPPTAKALAAPARARVARSGSQLDWLRGERLSCGTDVATRLFRAGLKPTRRSARGPWGADGAPRSPDVRERRSRSDVRAGVAGAPALPWLDLPHTPSSLYRG